MARRRTDNADSTVRRRRVYPLPNGEKVEIRSLGLNDYVMAREEALAGFKRQRIATWTKNLDLMQNVPAEQRHQLVQSAFERAEEITIEDLPQKQMHLPVRGKGGKFQRDGEGKLLTKVQTVEYAAWWMSETPEGRLFMTWLSIRRSKPDFTLEDADEIFREHMDELEAIADEVGEISGPQLGNSPAPEAEPTAEKTATETPEQKRQRRKNRRRRTGR